ncbi:Stage V sporulation protein T [compost metagenome]
MITDRDSFIALAGGSKKDYLEKPVGALLEKVMENRKTVIETNSGNYDISKEHSEQLSSYVAAPIISGGDPIGCVVLLNKDDSIKMSQLEIKMSETAAAFLGKQMEQ